MYQESQRENVHIIKSIRAWKACQSFAAITVKHNLCSFSTKNAPGNPACMGVLQPLLTNQDEIRFADKEITF